MSKNAATPSAAGSTSFSTPGAGRFRARRTSSIWRIGSVTAGQCTSRR